MKKDNKKIIALIAVGLFIIIIGIILLLNINTETPNDKITEKIDFVKEFENVSISGNVEDIYEVKINEISEDSDEFKSYINNINYIKEHFEKEITKSVVYEVKFFDKNGEEFIPNKPVTIYIKTKCINTYDASGYELLKLNQNNSEQMYDWRLRTDSGETTLCFKVEKSENLVLLCWGDKRKEPEYIEKPEQEEKPIMEITKKYKISELSYEEMKEKYNITSPTFVKGINHINKFDGVIIDVYEVEFQLDANGHGIQETLEPINSYTSFIYLNNKKDITTNMITEKKENFESVFGFDYKSCNGIYDIYYNILKNQGLTNFNYENAEFDTYYYMLTGECKYNFINTDELVKEYIKNMKYDRIISCEAFYLAHEDNFSNIQDKDYYFPNALTITINYEKDGIVYRRNIECFYVVETEKMLDMYLNTDLE